MELLRNITLFVLVLSLTGCFSEDYSICPPDEYANVTLHFSLKNREGIESFADNISTVDVLIYNGEGTFQDSVHVTLEELQKFQGTHLTLPAGEYRLVCWGNSGDEVEMKGVRREPTPTITYAKIEDNRVGNTDRVYYAGNINETPTKAIDIPERLKLVVPKEGEVDAEALFRPAHRILTVCVQGYTEDYRPANPAVELKGLPWGLNLLSMDRLTDEPAVDSYQMTTEREIDGERYSCSSFKVFWFEIDNSIEIEICNPATEEVVYTISLNDAVEGSIDNEVIEINIVFRFINGEVEIEIPNWGSNDVGWE